MAERMIDANFLTLSILLVAANFGLCLTVISKIPYTEIDWVAYMEEVSGVLNDGQLDYLHLRGGTGPLVYPAGFVYIFSALYYVTDRGRDIRTAQYIFAVFHSLTLAAVLAIYRMHYKDCSDAKKFPIWIVGFLLLSRRVVSLFVLRLFNDGVQMLLMYVSILLFMKNKWSIGCFLYSLSVSVKMNALLFAPGLAVLLCQARGVGGAVTRILGICLTTQLILGAPFLLHAPQSYLSRAFELTRQFLYKWSVNGAFLEEPTFLDKNFSILLLALHLVVLLAFGHLRWTARESGGLLGLLHLNRLGRITWPLDVISDIRARDLNPSHVANVLFASNFIGICFARTLHYQFYLWYAHALPLLAFRGSLPWMVKALIPVMIEAVFNIYPPHPMAAVVLHLAHFTLLSSLSMEKGASEMTIFAGKQTTAKTNKTT